MTSQYENDHKEQAKIERVFRLISLLKGRRRTVPQLASAINTSPRSLYRYLKLLEKLGYLLDCDEQNRYWIFEAETSKVVFTVEETALLRPLLASLKNTSPLHASIERKIYLTSELIPLAEELLDRRKGIMVTKLNQAIQERRQVNLLRYHSPHSNSTSDRLVEPLSFTDDFATLNAYEIGSKTIKSFKVNRIDEVELLDSWQVNDEPIPETDLFGWTGETPILVELHLAPTAYHLLIEEFPAARPFTERRYDASSPFTYQFRAEIRDFRGVGRFILGLHKHIQVVKPQGLKDYLNDIVAGMRY